MCSAISLSSGQVAARAFREIYNVNPEASDINTAVILWHIRYVVVIKAISCFCLLGQVQMIDVMRRSLCVRALAVGLDHLAKWFLQARFVELIYRQKEMS